MFCLEPVTVELFLVNPLKVVLVLNEVTLLWSFLPSIPGQEKPQLITNEVFSSVKVSTVQLELSIRNKSAAELVDKIITSPLRDLL